jgi:adenosylcobinamide-GDP ribazoletransferase
VSAVAALRGAVGFLTRLPVGHDEAGWEAFRAAPWTFPVVGALIGVVLALPLALPVGGASAALLFVLAVYGVTGINHLDGVADLGDAAVVHGTSEDRREVLKDTTVGVGAVLAVALVVLGLGTAGLALAALPAGALAVVVAAEVGAKTATALLACLGDAPHEGLGSALTEPNTERDAGAVLTLALPVLLLGLGGSDTLDAVLALVVTLLAAVLAGLLVWRWVRPNLGGVNGDVLGATTELARVAALHVGVIAWTRF